MMRVSDEVSTQKGVIMRQQIPRIIDTVFFYQ
jgi:hypothetical protein